jgi:hypothetical protein
MERFLSDETIVYVINDHVHLLSTRAYNKLESVGLYKKCPITRQPIKHAASLRYLIKMGLPLDSESELNDKLKVDLKNRVMGFHAHTKYRLNGSLTFLLAKNRIPLFRQLINALPTLAGQFTLEMLSTKLTAASGPNENTSALYYLAGSSDGPVLLRQMLAANRDLAGQFTAEMLSTKLTAAAGKYKNTSALYFLAGTADGRVLLKKMLDANPNLAGKITAEMLSTKLTAAVGCSAQAATSASHQESTSAGGGGLAKLPIQEMNPYGIIQEGSRTNGQEIRVYTPALFRRSQAMSLPTDASTKPQKML